MPFVGPSFGLVELRLRGRSWLIGRKLADQEDKVDSTSLISDCGIILQ